MRSNVRSVVQTAVMLLLVLGFVSRSQATNPTGYAGGVPWQTGDIVVCFGAIDGFGGACNVLRIVNGTAILLDEFTDNLDGNAFGVAINNSLHVVATDDAGGSKVVVYSVPSLNVNVSPAAPIAHKPVLYPPDPNAYYDTSLGGTASNVKAVAFNNAGDIFVLNSTSNTGNPNIVEIGPGPGQTPVATFSLSSCKDSSGNPLNQATSMDLSGAADANGNSLYAYVTSGGTIQQIKFSDGSCTKFADFGANVTLSGIKDIPPKALSSVSPNCNGTTCPADETLLVVAMGNTDPDASTGEGGEVGSPDPDAVNVCTNQLLTTSPPVSCALLLDTNLNPGLTAPLWQAGTLYNLSNPILDPDVKLQTEVTAGTSGGDEPSFSETGATVIDNAVKWTDIAQPVWLASNKYITTGTTPAPGTAAVAGTFFVDPNGNLQTVSITGTSGPVEPGNVGNPVSWNTSPGGATIDGLQWQDQGFWQSGTLFQLGAAIGDSGGHPQTVFTAGTSGATVPNFSNTTGVITPDNAVIWTNQGLVSPYLGGTPYGLGAFVTPNSHVQKTTEPGTSGATTPSFSSTGGTTMDGGVTWADQGLRPWHPSFGFLSGAVIVDPALHVQQVTTAGTSGPTQPAFNESGSTTTDGLQWTDQGMPATWAATTPFTANQFIVDNGNPTPHIQQVVFAGTSGGSEGPFSTTGGYTLDGSVVWLDRGVATYQTNHAYNVGDAFSDGTHIQQATTAGTSGGSAPVFANSSGTVTPDNAVVWTDEGALTWQMNFGYTATTPATTYIVDPAGHLQQPTIAGTSGPAAPQFNDGGTTTDNTVTWTDEGLRFWHAGAFASNAVIRDAAGHLQDVTTAGTSGPTQPTFNDIGSTTTDGLQWTDQGGPALWVGTTPFTAGQFIVDNSSPTLHVQQVVVAGTTGGTEGPFNTSGGVTVDGSVVWIDRGVSTYQKNNPYAVNSAFSDGTDIQQATSAGTSGGTEPTFANVAATITPDNAVVWTDEGVLTWAANFNYDDSTAAKTFIIDAANHVQQATIAGTSGGAEPNPFNDGGTVYDGLLWTDIGPVLPWNASSPFSAPAFAPFTLVIGGGFVQQATTAGISGTPSQPNWKTTPGLMTVDGLQWTDQGLSVWTAAHQYFTLGTLISETTSPFHAQKVYEEGTSGGSTPPFNHSLGLTPDNAVTWTESHPSRATSKAYVSSAIVLDTFASPIPHVQQVTSAYTYGVVHTGGTTGPLPNPFAFSDVGATVIDGLQWQIQAAPPTSVIARYPVNGTTTLTSLALDPLIADCTAGCNYPLHPLPLKVTSVITSPGLNNPTLGSPGFWLGDSQSANFYNLDFASGTATTFSANGNMNVVCPGPGIPSCATISSIQGLGVYDSEGANQPGLAKLLFNTSNTAANNQTGYYPSSTSDAANVKNSLELTLYSGTSPAATLGPFAMYASAVAPGSCFDDSTGNPLCLATFQPGGTGTNFPIMWKDDIPLPSSGNLRLNPSTQTLTGNFDFPTTFQSFLNDVQLDSQFDVTTSNGTDRPGYTSPSTVHGTRSKQNSTSPFEGNYGCAYTSPVISPSKQCYANPGTIPIKFTCTKLPPGTSLRNFGLTLDFASEMPPLASDPTPWGPNIVVKEFGPPPIPNPPTLLPNPVCTGVASTGGAPSKTNAGNNEGSLQPGGCDAAQLPSSNGATTATFKGSGWTYNWGPIQSTSKGVVYEICTEDDSDGSWSSTGQKEQEFCSAPFYVKNSCP